MDKAQFLNMLLESYSHRYDISRDVTAGGQTFPAVADYYLRDENYLLSRQHVLSTVESFEYVYFVLADHLDAATLSQQLRLTLELGKSRVRPSRTHMCSYVTLVVLADTIEPEAQRLLRRTRYRKNFRLALHGWMEYRVAAVEFSTASFFSNPPGKGVRQHLEQNYRLQANKQKGDH